MKKKMRKSGKGNQRMVLLIAELKKSAAQNKAGIWKAVAKELEKSARQKRIVNISRINRFTADSELVVVPGKVLGSGALDHKITVAAFSFSNQAKTQIEQASGRAISIQDLLKEQPKGTGVRIIC